MKKLLIISTGIVVFLLAVVGVTQLNAGTSSAQLAEGEIVEKVGNEYPGDVTNVDPLQHNGQPAYEVELANDQGVYALMIDAAEGEVMNLEIIEARTESGGESEEETNDEEEETESVDDELPVSAAEAVQIAANEVDGIIEEMELEIDDEGTYYEIEIESSSGDIDIDIDAYTGEILVFSYDD
ncbi:PepSY domain-containing protein [Salicibibacter cibarius]|uniref:PepSY domain-containing protein n=1 Tax=Salicibibacter cibarius TaxID=2743000 RepID=A0A7T7CD58_9BACI|nr:PepSY domain-containing protein [Salicibibacter cibarius]QQK77659.1 PepSY domain-containing protein [Salicibibacter cibarius]